jgi:Ca-activated chloride channel homolog
MIGGNTLRRFTVTAGILAVACYGVGLAQNHRYSFRKRDSAIKVDVDLVTVNVTVTDQDGRPITGLLPEDFRVWEDKVEQQIISFDAEEAPASVGVLLDVSASMQRKIMAGRNAAVSFLKNSNDQDEYFLIEFSNRARLVQKFTNDVSQLQGSLSAARISGMTAMYDAVYLGTEILRSGRHSRRALLLITDGSDNRSRYTLTELDEFLKEANVQIYPIGIIDGPSKPNEPDDERSALQEIADTSGGHAFFPRSPRKLDDICTKIAVELKTQYVIGYKSTNAAIDGRWRKIRVRLQRHPRLKRLRVRSRSGYYAPSAFMSHKLVR